MSIQDWAELHGETGEQKELYAETHTSFSFYINEHVDYDVLVHIRVFTDGTRICEIEDEILNQYDDNGTLEYQFSVSFKMI
jgi:hypothetical protein